MVCLDCEKKVEELRNTIRELSDKLEKKDKKVEELRNTIRELSDKLDNGNYIEVFPLDDGVVRITTPNRRVGPDGDLKLGRSSSYVDIENIEVFFNILMDYPENVMINHADIKARLMPEHGIGELANFRTNRSGVNFPTYYRPIKVLQAWRSVHQPSGGGPNAGVKRLSDQFFGDSPENMTLHYNVYLKSNKIVVIDENGNRIIVQE